MCSTLSCRFRSGPVVPSEVRHDWIPRDSTHTKRIPADVSSEEAVATAAPAWRATGVCPAAALLLPLRHLRQVASVWALGRTPLVSTPRW